MSSDLIPASHHLAACRRRGSRKRRWETAGLSLLMLTGSAGALLPAGAQETAKPAEASATKKKSPPAKPAEKAPKPDPAAPAKPTVPASTKPAKKDASVAFFRDGVIPRLKIQISDPELQRLRQQNREYVRCTVTENDQTVYEHVGVHLKGAAGSFRGIDDRPALTLNFDKYKDDQEFHDLDKIHLNNSVQDPTFLHELISSELFLAAGVPAARATHARVWLNGRDLGFYVLKEGFNKGFLKRHFANPDGNLYEGGFVQDLDGQPKLQNGEGVADQSDVKAVVAACREGDAAKRWQRVEQLVDLDKFFSFKALEMMTCHWDGYVQNRNNYRYYFDPKTNKLQFFPHGMDQMFQDPNFPIMQGGGSMVTQAIMSNPEWRGLYRDRFTELMKLMVPPDRLLKRVDEHAARMRPVLAEMGAGHANNFDGQVRGLKDRLTARAQSLLRQNAVVEARPLRFTPAGTAALTRWEPKVETPDAKLAQAEAPANMPNAGTLTITAGPSGRCVASWRTKVLLTAGKYRLEGRARTQGVKAIQESSGTGAGLRLSGGGRTNKLEGTANWTPLTHEFQIGAPTQEVVLVAELRATAGQVTFETGSLRLVRLPN